MLNSLRLVAINALKTKAFWYLASVSAGAALTIAPVGLRWGNRAAGWSYLGAGVSLAVAYPLSRSVSKDVTALSVTRHMGWLAEVEDTVSAYNTLKACNAAMIRQISGNLTLAELQEQMNSSMVQMTGAMSLLTGQPPRDALPAATSLPVVDVAELAANCLLDSESGGSVLAAAPRRTGKSALQRATIRRIHHKTQGLVDFKVFAGKYGEKFCGLEKSPQDYIFSGSVSAVPEVCDRLSVYANLVERRNGEGLPTILFSDEHNNLLGAAGSLKDNPEADQKLKKASNLVNYQTARIVTQGPSKRVNSFLTSHSPLVTDIGLNTQLQYSIKTLILASHLNAEALEGVLFGTGTKTLISDKQIRDGLAERYKGFTQNAPKQWFVCLHNFGGDWQLCQLPDYGKEEKAAPPIAWSFCNRDNWEEDSPQPDPIDSLPTEEQIADWFSAEDTKRQEQIRSLESLLKADPTEQLSPPARAILDKYVQKEMFGVWIDAKWVKNYVFYTKELKDFSPAQVRGFLKELAATGRGFLEGDGEAVCWYMEANQA
ncbi:hypothetical protein [Egbenema bharatensis]|uniref:hypothetical protein n=1 Tax=Egbenema bharatensis TaxID=3463334 RepID=UPI003A8C46C6